MNNETAPQFTSYLSFKLEEEVFAVNVSKVLEIQEIRQITKVPRTPAYMRGVLNLRGNVLPVVDTRIKFGMSPTQDTVNTCILVLDIQMDNEHLTVGALVDSVQEVIEIVPEQIGPAPSIGSKFKSEFIKGMGKVNDVFIMILDMDRVFSSDELVMVKDSMSEPIS